jgi:hypothetical protein
LDNPGMVTVAPQEKEGQQISADSTRPASWTSTVGRLLHHLRSRSQSGGDTRGLHAPRGSNLALRKPATQSSVSDRWSAGSTPEDDARGANNDVVNGSQGFTTDCEPYPWWQVDLEALCRVQEVHVYNRRDNADRLRRFSILVSLDGVQWIECFRKSDDSVFGSGAPRPFIARPVQPCIARFVRLQLNGTNFLHFNECRVFGEPVEEAEAPQMRALFEARLAAEEQRMRSGTGAQLGPEEIEAELALSQALFPFPRSELRRTQWRRWILEFAAPGGTGAEIGVFRGHYSEVLLERLKPRKLYLIDPWEKMGEYFTWSDAYTNFKRLPTRVARRDAQLRAARFAQTEVVFVEDFFPACRPKIADPLDWIYLDASHRFDETLAELRACAAMTKPGGLIMGDDFYPDPKNRHHAVFLAVNQFVSDEPFDFVAAGPAGQWCIRHNAAKRQREAPKPAAERPAAAKPAPAAAKPAPAVAKPAVPRPSVVDIAQRVTGRKWASERIILSHLGTIRPIVSVVEVGCASRTG